MVMFPPQHHGFLDRESISTALLGDLMAKELVPQLGLEPCMSQDPSQAGPAVGPPPCHPLTIFSQGMDDFNGGSAAALGLS